MTYTQAEWVLLFFLYCFLGWIWECCYVSVKKREWINRGFFYGPWLPIYGFGAIVILLSTRPAQDSLPLIFLGGMTGATALELVTGWAMEQLFHMRYWDYSDQPLNFHGYICFFVSLSWGVFSVLLVKFIQPVAEKFLSWIPDPAEYPLSIVLTVLFAVDVTKSVQATLDTRALLEKITQNSQTMGKIAQLLENSDQQFQQLKEQFGQALAERRELLPDKATLQQRIAERHSRRAGTITQMLAKTEFYLEDIRQKLAAVPTQADRERLERIQNALAEFRQLLMKAAEELQEKRPRDFRQAISILRRNPTARSRHHENAFRELKKLKEQSRRKRDS